MRNILFVFCFFLMTMMHGQSISGVVHDKATNEPLEGASVYFDGSSFGTITNEKGEFKIAPKLEATAALIVTHIGYGSIKIEYFEFEESLRIAMIVEVFEIPEVVVASDPFSRKQKLDVFRKEFLGDAEALEYCTILNEDALELYFNTSENTLSAYTNEPLLIENKYLGYKITFDLKEFQISFRSKSLKRLDNIRTTIFQGHSLYDDIAVNSAKLLARRELVFEGSIQHLMRNIWNQSWTENKFKVRLKNKSIMPNEAFKVSVGTALENKRVDVPEKKIVLIFKSVFNYRSTLTLLGDQHFLIDKYGNFHPNKKILIAGHLSSHRLCKTLPFDYQSRQIFKL